MEYIFGPRWFYGIDYIFDLVSVIVGLLITYFAYRAYKYTSQKKYFHFAASFFLVALAFVSNILRTIPVYSRELRIEKIGLITITSQVVDRVSWINQFGISIARLLMLFAFLILVLVSLKIKDKGVVVLLVYFLIISTTLVSASYIVFHIALLIMLSILFLNYRKNYLRVKTLNAKIVMYSFCALLASQLFFIFEGTSEHFYVIAVTIQLIGYLILLFAIIKILLKK